MITEAEQSRDIGRELAESLEAIRQAEMDEAERRKDFKARMERLQKIAYDLRMEILTGQKRLPLEVSGPSAADLDAAANDYPHRTEATAN